MKVTAVRHEESQGNVFAEEARKAGSLYVERPVANPLLSLSLQGFRNCANIDLSGVLEKADTAGLKIVSSPYLRCQQTMKLSIAGAFAYEEDERIRDREFGVLDGLTPKGVEELYPEEHKTRALMGKFYHRPSGGESWADVVLRCRSFLFEQRMRGTQHLLLFSHDVTILCMLYICNSLTVDEILTRQKEDPILNGSVTEMEYR